MSLDLAEGQCFTGVPRRGVYYIAMGKRYRQECRLSVRSLRAVSPGLGIVVATDVCDDTLGSSEQVVLEGVYSLASKPTYISNSPFEETLFVDSDTFFARDVRPLFDLLQYYELCVQFGGCQFNGPEGMTFHARANSGAILFRRSERIAELFEDWRNRYQKEMADRGADGLSNERALTEAIANSKARIGVLNAFVYVNLETPSVFMSPPVILHGRPPSFSVAVTSISRGWDLQSDWSPRVWLPSLRGLLPRGVRRSDPLLAIAFLLRRLWNEVRMRWHRKREHR